MAKVLISPGKYVQGAGEMKKLGVYAEGYRMKALISISEGGYRRIGKDIENSFVGTGCMLIFDYFHGGRSKHKIERSRGVIKRSTCNLVVGIGGGKISDTAKVVAHYGKTAVLIRPAIASADAPCSALSVICTDEGVFKEYLFLPINPNLVLMDTDIITRSPIRLTIAGMGDALATYFEVRACEQSDAVSCVDGKVTGTAMTLVRLCLEALMEGGVKMKLALGAGVRTPAVEKIIEVNTLPDGISFESASLIGAHAIHSGLTVLEECHHMYHGEKVAFGITTQLVSENVKATELQEIIEFCIELGLPVIPEELGVAEITRGKVMAVAKVACTGNDTLYNMSSEVTPDKVYAAIIAADAYGYYFLNEG